MSLHESRSSDAHDDGAEHVVLLHCPDCGESRWDPWCDDCRCPGRFACVHCAAPIGKCRIVAAPAIAHERSSNLAPRDGPQPHVTRILGALYAEAMRPGRRSAEDRRSWELVHSSRTWGRDDATYARVVRDVWASGPDRLAPVIALLAAPDRFDGRFMREVAAHVLGMRAATPDARSRTYPPTFPASGEDAGIRRHPSWPGVLAHAVRMRGASAAGQDLGELERALFDTALERLPPTDAAEGPAEQHRSEESSS